jgi:hypothetical protein
MTIVSYPIRMPKRILTSSRFWMEIKSNHLITKTWRQHHGHLIHPSRHLRPCSFSFVPRVRFAAVLMTRKPGCQRSLPSFNLGGRLSLANSQAKSNVPGDLQQPRHSTLIEIRCMAPNQLLSTQFQGLYTLISALLLFAGLWPKSHSSRSSFSASSVPNGSGHIPVGEATIEMSMGVRRCTTDGGTPGHGCSPHSTL